jgi:hypothetical protein
MPCRLIVLKSFYIQNIMEIDERNACEVDPHFLNEIASLFEPWGMQRSVGRFYAYLLLCEQPVPLEKIAADLQMSRSGAWNAARLLEGFGHIRRESERGSKRALYSQSDNYGAPLLEQTATLAAIASRLNHKASRLSRGKVRDHLRRRADFYLSMRKVVEEAVEALIDKSGARMAPTSRTGRRAAS